MTQEDKALLLKDLCGRLPYGVKVNGVFLNYNKDKGKILYERCDKKFIYEHLDRYETLKPYLFPLSSMTDKQYDEFFNYYHNIEIEEIKASGDYLKAAYLGDSAKYEWLNRNNFDWRYLIDKGLAIDATGLNIYQ